MLHVVDMKSQRGNPTDGIKYKMKMILPSSKRDITGTSYKIIRRDNSNNSSLFGWANGRIGTLSPSSGNAGSLTMAIRSCLQVVSWRCGPGWNITTWMPWMGQAFCEGIDNFALLSTSALMYRTDKWGLFDWIQCADETEGKWYRAKEVQLVPDQNRREW